MIEINELKLNDNNPRFIRDERFQKLKDSIEQFPKMMKLRPIVVDKQNIVLGGNMRLRALIDLGYKSIPGEWVKKADELNEEEKRRFIIADNTGFGEWDYELLANGWDAAELETWGLELPDEWSVEEPEAQEDGYEMPDEIETDVKEGDLIEIGPHRLLCGDSTKAEDVGRLLGDAEPKLMVTDPPYGVEYDPEWRVITQDSGFGAKIKAKGKVTNDDKVDWSGSWILSTSEVAYIWHADRHASEVQSSIESCGYSVRSQIIWAKPSLTLSRGHYHWQHEPCWYAVKKGSNASWIGDRKQTTLWQIAGINPVGRSSNNEDLVVGHGTQKPIECMARPIRNHEGDVYDPFLGSGTTMVAAHQLNRICYGMEIDPKYCQVIIDRMHKLAPDLEIKINGEKYEPKVKEVT